MDTDKKYFAFISYKREDEKQTEWLQDKLEHYRFPTNLNGRTDLPKSVRPTFRDVTDLKPGFLAEEISNALNDSQWLIIVCSPRSAKSPWVCKEAQTFIDSGRADRIIPYVIEGVPFSGDEATECYPDALLKLTGSRELLAANVNEMGRDAALIKVLARMFNLRFDTLWQRHTREQRKKRILWGSVAAFVVVLSVLISGWFYRANNEISRQKTQIDNQYHELVDKQDNLLITQSRYLMSEAQKEYDKGNITKALRMALYALPKDLDNPDRPYVVEAERMLRYFDFYVSRQCLRTILKHNNDVKQAFFSPDNKYFISKTKDNTVYVWDTKSGILVNEPLKNIASLSFDTIGTCIALEVNGNLINVWDVISNKIITPSIKHDGDVLDAILNANGNMILVKTSGDYVYNWDINGKMLCEPIYCYGIRNLEYAADGSSFLVVGNKTVKVYETISGNQIYFNSWLNKEILDFAFAPDGKSIVVSDSDNIYMLDITSSTKTSLDIDEDGSFLVRSVTYSPSGEYVLATTLNNHYIWNSKDGECLRQYNDNEFPFISFKDEQNIIITTDKNVLYNLDIENNEVEKILININPGNVYISPYNNFLAICEEELVYVWNIHASKIDVKQISNRYVNNNGKCIYTAINPSIEVCDYETQDKMLLKHDNLQSAMFDLTGKYIVSCSDDFVNVWDSNTGEMVYEPIKIENNIFTKEAYISPDGQFVYVTGNGFIKMDAKTGERIEVPPLSYTIGLTELSPERKYIFNNIGSVTAIYDAYTGKDENIYVDNDKYGEVLNYIVSDTSKYLITNKSSSILVSKANNGIELISSFSLDSKPVSAAMSSNGKYVVGMSEKGRIRVWNIENDSLCVEYDGYEFWKLVEFTDDGKNIVCTATPARFVFDDQDILSILPFPPLQELIDKYRNDPEHDWSLSQEEKDEYSLE